MNEGEELVEMSEPGPQVHSFPLLPAALYRIAIGIVFGSIIIAILFNVWTLTVYGSGPAIGILVFNFISLLSISYIIINKLFQSYFCKLDIRFL